MSDAADELRFLSRALRQAGSRDVIAELRDGLKRAAGPAADDARASILSMPARKYERELRSGIAATVQVSTTLGASSARVTVSASGPDRWPGAAATIESGKWNHPVFGDRERWVHGQPGKPGWFGVAVSLRQADFDRAVDQVADKIERDIAGGP